MLEFVILMLVLSLLTKIPVGEPEAPPEYNPYDNGTAEAYTLDHPWEFKSLDDCMEFRELRKSGWRGNAADFYKWKEEE